MNTSTTNTDQWLTEQQLLDAGLSRENIEEAEHLHLIRKSEKDGVVQYRQTYLSQLLSGDVR